MHTQFSRLITPATVLLLVAVVLPYQAQAQEQEYPIAEAQAAHLQLDANILELSARAWNAWGLAGGECPKEVTCHEWVFRLRAGAELLRALADFNEPTEGNTAQDEVRTWRDTANQNEERATQAQDQADKARQNTGEAYQRAAEAFERVVEAYEEQAEAAYALADLWDKRAGN